MKKRFNRYSAGHRPVLPDAVFLGVAALVGWWLYAAVRQPLVVYLPIADYWQYAAVLHEWLQGFSSPGHPYVADGQPGIGFTPYLALLTLIGGALGLDATQALAVGVFLNFGLIAVGLYLFSSGYFRSVWAPAVSLVVVFFCWGISWNQHNVYQLGSFLYTASYPSAFAFGLSLIAFRLTVQIVGSGTRAPLWGSLMTLVIATVFLSDPVTAVFAVIGCLLLALTEPSGSQLRRLLAIGMALAGLGVAELWPWFSPWQAALGFYDGVAAIILPESLSALTERVTSGNWGGVLYDPWLATVTLGLALLGVPLMALLLFRRQQPFIVYGGVSMLALFLLNLVVVVAEAERFLMFFAFYLQLAIVWGWLRVIGTASEIPRPPLALPFLTGTVAAGVGVVVVNLWMADMEFDGRRLAPKPVKVIAVRPLPDGLSVAELYAKLLAAVPADAVILAPGDQGLSIPVFKGKVVASRSRDPVLADDAARYQATHDFFFRPISELDRLAIIQRYRVSHVLLDNALRPVAERTEPWVASYGRLVGQLGSYRVYELSPALHDIALPEQKADAVVAADSLPPANAAAGESGDARDGAKARRAGRFEPVAGGSSVSAPRSQPESSPVERNAESAGEPVPRSYGAPIAAPVLDPSRNGG